MSPEPQQREKISASGLTFAIASYTLWGFLPLLFFALRPSGAIEIVSWRIALSLVFCCLIITVTWGWARLVAVLRDRRSVLTLAAAAVFILINWLVYVFASVTGHIVEASLGYFTNPIVTVLLGVLVLRERLRVLQWVAIGVSTLAVLVLSIGYGAFPWIAISLAASFGLYGLVKKRVGSRVDAVSGLTVETAILSPLAIVALVALAATGSLTIGTVSPVHTALMLGVGVATAVPLILFAAAARRLPLTYLGLVQYIAPLMQLLVGVFLFREDMPPARWAGFGIVWLALAILTVDTFLYRTRGRGAAIAA